MCSKGLYQIALALIALSEISPGIDNLTGNILLIKQSTTPFIINNEPLKDGRTFYLGKKMLFKSSWRKATQSVRFAFKK
ncbi:MAG: hypothetical protein N4J56_003039 [Chroococcidiopsis sp. SAG 2025]|nr:hypothetical protein [Chroococcidiopsis sp. SAG 2025]